MKSGLGFNSSRLLALPPEIRTTIWEYVFDDQDSNPWFSPQRPFYGVRLNDPHRASIRLRPLLTCRQIYHEASSLAFKRVTFIINGLFITDNVPARLSTLRPGQQTAIRSITLVADARLFRTLIDWDQYPFSMPYMNLDVLTIALHRSSFWHYLMDFTSDMVKLLRRLQGVKRLVFMRNRALVKGSFRTWYNRLVGLIMKVDHAERYERSPPQLENVWWRWKYDDAAQSFTLNAQPPKEFVAEESYMQWVAPLVDELRMSIESEKWIPDPPSLNLPRRELRLFDRSTT